jgi:hypothetical protein
MGRARVFGREGERGPVAFGPEKREGVRARVGPGQGRERWCWSRPKPARREEREKKKEERGKSPLFSPLGQFPKRKGEKRK